MIVATGGPLARLMRSLRLRLAVTAFLTAYAPTFLLLLVSLSFSGNVNTQLADVVQGGEVVEMETTIATPVGIPLWVVVLVTICFAPFAAAFAWWWSGRAVRPIAEAVALQERLIEETSHELRTPLAVLSNNAQVLLHHPEPTLEVYRQGLKRSEAVAERMSETIDSLLVDARGRARTIDRTPTDLAVLCRSVASSLSTLSTRNEVTLQVGGVASLEARVDGSSVERAVTNLVTNAVQHSPPGATVQIDVSAAGHLAEIAVTDTGPGIPTEDQGRIFERYWQSEADARSGVGSGIGLAIVRQVAIAHGGTVTVVSPVDDRPGARFTLQLAI